MNKENLCYHRTLLADGFWLIQPPKQALKDLQGEEDTTRDQWQR